MKFEWEHIDCDMDEGIWNMTHRAKVIGGWVLLHRMSNEKEIENDEYLTEKFTSPTCSMIFIPDPIHEWTIE